MKFTLLMMKTGIQAPPLRGMVETIVPFDNWTLDKLPFPEDVAVAVDVDPYQLL